MGVIWVPHPCRLSKGEGFQLKEENHLPFRVFRFGRGLGRLTRESRQPLASRPIWATFEEFSSRLKHAYLFRNGHGDPLIHGDTIFLRKPLRGFLVERGSFNG